MKKFTGLLIVVMLLLVQCSKDDAPPIIPNNNPPAVAKGDLAIYVHLEKETGSLWGGALVNVYKTKEDRDSNNVFRFNYTASQVPFSAIFDTLDVQKWYVRASFFYQGKDYEGDIDVNVYKDAKSSYHVTATKK